MPPKKLKKSDGSDNPPDRKQGGSQGGGESGWGSTALAVGVTATAVGVTGAVAYSILSSKKKDSH